jgi:hypothetical protein
MNAFLFGTTLVLHLIVAWRTQRMINKTVVLTPNQKRINSTLNLLVPFLWSFIVLQMIKPSKVSVITKSNRKTRKGKHTDNWQGLTGYGGDSSFGD